MSFTLQLIALIAFLCYSMAYALFVAWVSERVGQNRPRRTRRLAGVALGGGLLLTVLLVLVPCV